VLRGLDRKAEEEKRDVERQEKALAEFKEQMGRPFEHEARLKELLVKQAQLNAALDLDKHEAQVVAETAEHGEKAVPASFAAREQAKECVAMRAF
jgi:hypothetical protein